MSFATVRDVYDLGLSAKAFVRAPLPVANMATDFVPSTGTIRIVGHGLSPLDLVYLVVTSGGTLPGGAAALTYYSPLPLGSELFRLAATPSGTALTFTSAGTGWSVAVDPERRLQRHLDDATAQIEEKLTANAVPIKVEPLTGLFDQILVGICARMAALSAVTSLQYENATAREAHDVLIAQRDRDDATLAEWLAGRPINVRPPDQDAIPNNAARVGATRAPVCWTTGRL